MDRKSEEKKNREPATNFKMGKRKGISDPEASLEKSLRTRLQLVAPQRPEQSQQSSQKSLQQADPLDTKELDAMIEKWTQAQLSQQLFNQEVEGNIKLKEARAELTETEREIQLLESRLDESQTDCINMSTSLEAKVKTRAEITTELNDLVKLQSIAVGQLNILAAKLQDCQQEKERVSKMYDIVILRQREGMGVLKQQLEDNNALAIEDRQEFETMLNLKKNQIVDLENKKIHYEKKLSEHYNIMHETQRVNENNRIQILSLTDDLEAEVRRASELTIAKEEIRKSVADLEAKITAEKNEFIQSQILFKEENLKLTEEWHETDEKLKVAEEKLEIVQCTIQTLSEEEARLNNELTETKYSHEETISKHDLELSEYRNRLQDSKNLHDSSVNQLQELIAKLGGQEKLLVQAEGKIKHLERDIKEKDDQISESIRNKSKYDKEVHYLKEKIKGQEKHQNIFVVEKAARVDKLKASEDKLNELLKSLEETRNENETFSKTIDCLNQQIESADKTIAEFEASMEKVLKQKYTRESEYNAKIQNATQSLQKFQSDNEKQLKEQECIYEKINIDLSAEKLNYEKHLVNANNTAALHNSEKSKLEQQLKNIKANYKELNEKFCTIQKNNDELQGQLKRTEEVTSSKLKNEARVRTKLTNYQEELRMITDEQNEKLMKLKILEANLTRNKTEFEDQRREQINKYDQLKDDRDKKSAEIIRLQAAQTVRIDKAKPTTSTPTSISNPSDNLNPPDKLMELDSYSSDLSSIFEVPLSRPKLHTEVITPLRTSKDVTPRRHTDIQKGGLQTKLPKTSDAKQFSYFYRRE